jgi:hypothetical protein
MEISCVGPGLWRPGLQELVIVLFMVLWITAVA